MWTETLQTLSHSFFLIIRFNIPNFFFFLIRSFVLWESNKKKKISPTLFKLNVTQLLNSLYDLNSFFYFLNSLDFSIYDLKIYFYIRPTSD
jgi:hypothetical protein